MATKSSNSDKIPTVTIQCRKGDSFDRVITFKTNGVTDDLSGCTFRLHVREVKPPYKLVLSFTMGSGASIVADQLVLSKTPAQMDSVAGGTYKHDLEQTFAGGKVKTRFEGPFIVNADVSYT